MSRPLRIILALLIPGGAAGGAPAEPPAEAFEIGAHNTAELPGGKEADGIAGDFVLRNRHLEAVISGNLPGRRANMTTNYEAPTPGCLYDLCLRGSANDQLTCAAPGGLAGYLSSVEPSAADDGAQVAARRTGPRGGGHGEAHIWRLGRDARHLLVISTFACEGEAEWKLKPGPVVKGLLDVKTFAGVTFGDAMNPRDRQGYAWAPVATAGPEASWDEVVLRKGEVRTTTVAIAPGRSPAEAFGIVAALRGPTGGLRARLHEAGRAAPSASLVIWLDEKTPLPGYPDGQGHVTTALPPGAYRYEAVDPGRPRVEGRVEIAAGGAAELDIRLEPAARVRLDITDATAGRAGRSLPCKVQFVGLDPTPSPGLGVDIQAHGCRNQYHSETGSFAVQVPPGRYRVVVTHGIEYSHHAQEILLRPDAEVRVAASLRRLVDTRGWISADFHNHSTPSGDNYCGTDDRIANLAAEQVEFAPTTEHNRFYDWAPHIKRLGLEEEISTVVGIELTGRGAHFNAFPFKLTRWVQDNGAPTWQQDPRLNAIVLRDFQEGGPDRYVQINHPSVGEFFRDRNADGAADGGFAGLEDLIDAAEVWSAEILNPAAWLPTKDRDGKPDWRENRTLAWLQLLNQGRRLFCVAVSDAHSVFGNGVGGWRTYLPSSTDEPARIDHREIVRHARAGRMVMTTGPFLEVKLDDGTLPGGQTIAAGGVALDVKVQCTDWIDIDRVQVLVNGRQARELNFTRAANPELFGRSTVRFERRIPVPLTGDAHLIVVAIGEAFSLKTGYGDSWQGEMHPIAFSNPIFVDLDGRGFEPNGDTLDQPLPHGKKPPRPEPPPAPAAASG